MHALLHVAVLALTIFGLSRWMPNLVYIRSAGTAVVVALVFSVLNFFLGTVLGWLIGAFIFIPAVLTLGLLFLLIPFFVNTVILWLTDKMLANFEIATFGGLFASAGVITLVNSIFYAHLFHAAMTGAPVHPHTTWI